MKHAIRLVFYCDYCVYICREENLAKKISYIVIHSLVWVENLCKNCVALKSLDEKAAGRKTNIFESERMCVCVCGGGGGGEGRLGV